MIAFPKSITIDACEKIIKSINQEANVDVVTLPVDTAKYAFGGLASAIQAVMTWGRKSSERQLLLRKSNKVGEEPIEELIRRPHKFTATMFAKSISLDDKNNIDLRPQVYDFAKSAIEKQSSNRYGQQHGSLCWFAFVDHSSKGFDRNFYIHDSENKPEPRHHDQIQAVIHAMVEKSLQVSGGGKPPEGEDLNHLGRIFYELFINTHEHGSRGSIRSEWLKPGVRVVYTYGINLTDKGVKGILENELVLTSYLKAQTINKSRFIEISIIDSGLGYCDRWRTDYSESNTAKMLAIEEEYQIFKTCFKFRQTSTLKDNKGHGLPVVMDRLTKLKGFIRIRSGRLALYRDFIANPYNDTDQCEFTDWISKKSANQNLTEMPQVVGIAITLLIPLEAKQ